MSGNIDKMKRTLNSPDEFQVDIEKTFDAILNITSNPIFVKDSEFRLILVNDAFCKLFGLVRDDIIGKTLAEKVPSSEYEHFLSSDKKVLEKGEEIVCQENLTTNGKQTRILRTKKTRFIDVNGKPHIVGVIHDITDSTQSELREKTRTRVLELITRGEPLSIILHAIVAAVEQENPNMMCSILLLDDEGKHLVDGVAPSLPCFYTEAVNGVAIGKAVGSCGTAAHTNKRVIVDDIQTHPYWAAYKELASEAGLASCWSEPIRSTSGKVLGTFAIYHSKVNHPTPNDLAVIDRTAGLASIAIEKKQTEENLKRAASVFTHANEGIIITDANANIIEINDTFSSITGYSLEDVLGKNPRILQSDRHSSEFYIEMWDNIIKHGHWQGEIWNRRSNGEIYPEMLTISAVTNSDGLVQHYISVSTDITAIKENQSQLERIAHYDLLTNLPNRVLLVERINQAMIQQHKDKKSVAVAFMDLDGFMAINDAYGHDIGDELLVVISQNMTAALRENDTLARIGGDEFIAMMGDLESFEECEIVLKRLLEAVSQPISISIGIVQVTVSIGVTMYPLDDVNAEQLIRHADQAMYIAKQTGKNNYHLFDIAQGTAIYTQRKCIDDIKTALNENEFVLHYQPKVNMRSGEIIGAEALIRWEHPTKGRIPPLDFLPAIEGHVISLDIGEWVIESALKQILEWRKVGVNLSVSVNISAYQLQQNNFSDCLAALLAAYPDIDPSCLELEILETSALQDTAQVSQTMKTCQDLGVNFALDDFGTGYSSLTYLKQLPAHMIKIDQSFVRDMLEDKDDLAIVSGVVGLAKTFQREVIAEGVETPEHGLALLELGCELAQGYGIARPMEANDIPKWIVNWKSSEKWLKP
ncbi:bifunctional diguanylate cyclase/phosphodiesterase [Glaciecola petra]|uniref:EAL domain-containing protein n=1 Tax=Glaciecola petra TaxID=3075602 RepID=A0ABU2ZR84_9ALTE|nr:EAL domain-containing protein [Aestuariibacter sp. P117]MDT0595142.1 EAL domain-containing protein [Aestuariibacter sp. P117]